MRTFLFAVLPMIAVVAPGAAATMQEAPDLQAVTDVHCNYFGGPHLAGCEQEIVIPPATVPINIFAIAESYTEMSYAPMADYSRVFVEAGHHAYAPTSASVPGDLGTFDVVYSHLQLVEDLGGFCPFAVGAIAAPPRTPTAEEMRTISALNFTYITEEQMQLLLACHLAWPVPPRGDIYGSPIGWTYARLEPGPGGFAIWKQYVIKREPKVILGPAGPVSLGTYFYRVVSPAISVNINPQIAAETFITEPAMISTLNGLAGTLDGLIIGLSFLPGAGIGRTGHVLLEHWMNGTTPSIAQVLDMVVDVAGDATIVIGVIGRTTKMVKAALAVEYGCICIRSAQAGLDFGSEEYKSAAMRGVDIVMRGTGYARGWRNLNMRLRTHYKGGTDGHFPQGPRYDDIANTPYSHSAAAIANDAAHEIEGAYLRPLTRSLGLDEVRAAIAARRAELARFMHDRGIAHVNVPDIAAFGRLRTRNDAVGRWRSHAPDVCARADRGLTREITEPIRSAVGGTTRDPIQRMSRTTYYTPRDPTAAPIEATRVSRLMQPARIRSQNFEVGDIVLEHTTPENAAAILADVEARLQAVRFNWYRMDEAEVKREIAAAFYGLYQAMPYERGSAGIGNIYSAAFCKVTRRQPLPRDLMDVVDERAMTSLDTGGGQDEFVEWFASRLP